MGQPSFQASNTIINPTYGAFLCVRPHVLPHTRQDMLKVSAQGFGPLFCLVQERPVEVPILAMIRTQKG